jgi:3',5'-cyclic AMP phosphodiesterase CpdA
MNRRPTMRVLILGLVMAGWAASGALGAQGFTFAVLGDRTGGAVDGVFEQAVADVKFLDPDIILTVGDLIEGYLPDSAAVEEEWDYVIGLLDGTGIPYHLTPGNHDIWDPQSKRIYTRRFGAPDEAFVYKGNLFVILDASTYNKAEDFPPERLRWLENQLAKVDQHANKFVFYHKPFWCEDFSSGRPDVLHEIFKRYGVDAVFTGHYHRQFYTERDGIRYFGVSSSGGALASGGREEGCFYSYLLARVDGGDLEVRSLEPGFGGRPDAVTMENIVHIVALERDALDVEGIEVSGCDLIGAAKVTIGIHNSGSSTLRDTARWVSTGDWSIEPVSDYVEVPPGETGTMTAYASNDARLFPVPVFEINMAYDGGRVLRLSDPLPVKRVLRAVLCDSAPDIDGVLEDSWRGADRETCFFGSAPQEAPADSTRLWVCHDSKYLYVGVECYDGRVAELQANAETRDAFGGYDDYVLVLLEPKIGSNVFYQIAVNPRSTVFDKKIEVCPFGTYVQDYGWDAPADVGTHVYDDRWVAELRIPMESFGFGVDEHTRWGFNFRRMHKRLDAVSDFQTPLWYASDRLGILVFR